MNIRNTCGAVALGLTALASSTAAAETFDVTVSVQSLVPGNSVTFAPLHLGFNAGTFDGFDLGAPAGAPIAALAESGSGAGWFPAFSAADPAAVLGTVANGGPLLPGATASAAFTVDALSNPFFTFAAMVVPSNDFFIGNDDPEQYRLFDETGAPALSSIVIRANQIWDAGSEVFDPAAAAFVGDAALRTDQNSVVALNFAELAAFDGLTTAAGYVLESGLAAEDTVYRIDFDVAPVPIPAALPLFAGALGFLVLRVRRTA
jgi:hypothetical protein